MLLCRELIMFWIVKRLEINIEILLLLFIMYLYVSV